MIAIRGRTGSTFPSSRSSPPDLVHEQSSIQTQLNTRGTNIVVSSTDSDLEAFSHNPADGSFAALPGQTAAKTNYLNPRFLSY